MRTPYLFGPLPVIGDNTSSVARRAALFILSALINNTFSVAFRTGFFSHRSALPSPAAERSAVAPRFVGWFRLDQAELALALGLLVQPSPRFRDRDQIASNALVRDGLGRLQAFNGMLPENVGPAFYILLPRRAPAHNAKRRDSFQFQIRPLSVPNQPPGVKRGQSVLIYRSDGLLSTLNFWALWLCFWLIGSARWAFSGRKFRWRQAIPRIAIQ
jgi:hypothetical protein